MPKVPSPLGGGTFVLPDTGGYYIVSEGGSGGHERIARGGMTLALRLFDSAGECMRRAQLTRVPKWIGGSNVDMRRTAQVLGFLVAALITLLGSTVSAYAVWTPQTSGTTDDLVDVCFVDAQNGWAVGEDVILHTGDGGTTWSQQASGTTHYLKAVSFIDASRGWVVGTHGTILHTVDGGVTWTPQECGMNPAQASYTHLDDVCFVDEDHGWAVGSGDAYFRTSDGGDTWTYTQPSPAPMTHPNAVYFIDSEHGWTVGEYLNSQYTSLRRTTNGGATWSGVVPGTTLDDVCFVTRWNGWSVGRNGKVYYSENGGATWVTQNSGLGGYFPPWLHAVSFVNTSSGCVVGDGGTIIRTVNGGSTWTAESSGTTKILCGVTFVDADNGWAVGFDGTILRCDRVTPATSLAISPACPDGQNGWYRTPPTVTLTSSEPGVTFCSWDASSGPWTTYASPVVAPEGQHTLYYFSVDAAGNTESVRSQPIGVDTIAPTAAIFQEGCLQRNGWHVSDVNLVLESTDEAPGSGVAAIENRLNGAGWNSHSSTLTISAEGTTTVECRSIDAAGNVGEVAGDVVAIDRTAPSVTESVTGVLGQNGWYVSDVSLEFSGTDVGGSGIARIEHNLGDHQYVAPIAISAEGTTSVGFRAADLAGNIGEERGLAIKIDKSAPITTVTLTGETDADGVYRSDVRVALWAVDILGGSGLQATEYSFDGEVWNAYVAPFDVSALGTSTLYYRSVDNAGNVEIAGSCTLAID